MGSLRTNTRAAGNDPQALPKLLEELRESAPLADFADGTDQYRRWKEQGEQYCLNGHLYAALAVFEALHARLSDAEDEQGCRHNKGEVLFWLGETCRRLGWPWHARRFLMLSMCEDAVVPPEDTQYDRLGSYLTLVLQGGLPHSEYDRYFAEARKLHCTAANCGAMERFPEHVLLQLPDQDWMTSPPSVAESQTYKANRTYIRYLCAQLGNGRGEQLELLAQYLLSCIPGCRTARRSRSYSTDYDVVCVLDGDHVDFRSEVGRIFVCECKDWDSPADFTAFAKFCRVLDSVKARLGVLFSSQGISGDQGAGGASREQVKVFQDRGIVIVVVDSADLESLKQGANLIAMLRRKHEEVRLDLRAPRGVSGADV